MYYGKKGSIYELDGNVELKRAIPLGIQHVLVMFIAGLVTLIQLYLIGISWSKAYYSNGYKFRIYRNSTSN